MGGAQHHRGLPAHLGGNVRLQPAQHRAGNGQLREYALRQTERMQDLRVILPGLRIDKTGGSCVGVLARLHAAQSPEQIFRDHEEIVRLRQPSGFFVRIQLIDRVEGLELDAGAGIQCFKWDNAVHLVQNRLRPAVTVGVDRVDGFIFFQKHIVHRPCVNGQAFDLRISCKRCADTLFDMGKHAVNVPFQMSVHPPDTIGKTVHFLGAENAVLHPSYNVPPAGRTNVDGKIIFVHNTPPVWL